jgi:hypothetical protein
MFGATNASADVRQVLDIHGRWEFAVTSGDTAAQLTALGPTTFSTYLLENGRSLTNIVTFTTDTSVCDKFNFNNVIVTNFSFFDAATKQVRVTFRVTNNSPVFQYTFTGQLTQGNPLANPPTPTRINGTYQKTRGGCTGGSGAASDGNFAATFFPDMDGTWIGNFNGPNSGVGGRRGPLTMVIATNLDKSLSGTLTSSLTNASGAACFSGPVTLIGGTPPDGASFAAGVTVQLLGTDPAGTQVFVNATPVNPDGSTAALGEDNPANGLNGTRNDGTDNDLTAFYAITGGPCNALGAASGLTPQARQLSRAAHAAERHALRGQTTMPTPAPPDDQQ